jgi:hypothetical protein
MIQVDHIGVPARARRDAGGFLASVFGLEVQIADDGRFAPLPVSRAFTIVFYESEQVQPMHVAFLVDDAAFDAALGRLKSPGSCVRQPT